MSSFQQRFEKKKTDGISEDNARSSALEDSAASQVLQRVGTPPPDNECQAVVQTLQQDRPTLHEKLTTVGRDVLDGLVVVTERLKDCVDSCPPLETAAAVFLTIHKIFDGLPTNIDELKELETRSKAILSLMERYKKEGALSVIEERVKSFSTAIENLVEGIKHLQNLPLLDRVAKFSNDRGTIQKTLRDLNIVCDLFQIDIQFPTNVTMQNMLLMLNSRSIDKLRLESASYKSRHSAYGDPTGCMPGTRVNVLERLEAWASDEQGVKVYWLMGMAGTGKSTIAQSLCELLDKRQMLGASFFCSRASEGASNPRLIIPSVAYSLVKTSPTLKVEVAKVLKKDPDLVESNDFKGQFQKLISGPLQTVVGGQANVYKTVVIDALDECTNPHFVFRLIQLILSAASGLPLKFFLTSRADHLIPSAFNSSQGSHDTFLLHEIERDIVESDIRLYMKESLAEIKRIWDPIGKDGWPPESELSQIVKDSGKLFVYASTGQRYIREGGRNYKQRLTLLAMRVWRREQTSVIDGLYGHILTCACDGREEEELSRMETLLSFVIFLRRPLSMNALSVLSGISDPVTYLSHFNSVIHTPTEKNAAVSPFHASFPAFLINPKRCPPNQFSPFTPLHPASAHADLALKCLELMNRSLRYNICDTPEELTVSHMDRRNPPENASKISEALKYACVYWAVHLSEVRDSSQPALISALRIFLETHLLHWMECLSVVGRLKSGVYSLLSASGAISGIHITGVEDLQPLVDEARQSLQLSFECIEQHCFEVYQSTFTWIPKNSLMRRIYGAQVKQTARITLGVPDSWGPMVLCIKGGSVVNSIAFSNDSRQIVSGLDDGMVRVWNATTGELEAELEGHTRRVRSVAFSCDGTRVVSGSDDRTVGIWNATTGWLSARLEGHMGSVASVAFSPNGMWVASGSDDETVRVWNAMTGGLEATLEGHTHSVASVAFSPNSTRVASGSYDQTVRIWNTVTGRLEAKLEGHTHWITSVAFSPDSMRVASGSYDQTVRIWNATTGGLEAKLESHTHWVTSVAFSPDSMRVASGSYDQTVRIWNAMTGGLEAKLEGHTHWVTSVAFSPDGMWVASGSDDETVRVRNATTGGLEAKLKGHTHWVTSLAFSPDSMRVASGSFDCTVGIWDVMTGGLEAKLEGHMGSVTSVAFSPDSMRVASGSYDQTVRIWAVTTGRLEAKLEGHTGSVTSVAFSPDGTRVASGSYDQTLKIWNAMTGRLVAKLEGHTNWVMSVAFSPDSMRVASGSLDWTVRIWNVTTGGLEAKLEGHTHWVASVAFSPDSTRVASGSYDQTVRIWNAMTGGLEAKLEGYEGSVTSVSFSHDGMQVVSLRLGRGRVWNLTTDGAHVLTDDSHNIKLRSHPFSLSLSDDGHWVVGAHLHCWIPPSYRGISSCAFSADKACFGYASGSIVILTGFMRPTQSALSSTPSFLGYNGASTDASKGMNGNRPGDFALVQTSNENLLETLSDILLNKRKRDALLGLKDECAQLVIDFLDSALIQSNISIPWLRKHMVIVLYKLCKATKLYPRCYVLQGIDIGTCEDGGGFSDVYRGRKDEQILCLKIVRTNQSSDTDAMLRACAKEAILWRQLDHSNVVPFYGAYYLDETRKRVCLVSPWMSNGNIVVYLKKNPGTPREPLIYDIALGLEYLHEESLVHGDLKGMNILVNDFGRACITDFGLSFLRTDRTLAYTIGATTVQGCSYRWAAPELVEEDSPCLTPASDIWAFGCICLEVLTGLLPFHECRGDPQIIRKLSRGQLPCGSEPADALAGISDYMSELMNQCWKVNAGDRPSCHEIVQALESKGITREAMDEAQDDTVHHRRRFQAAMGKNIDTSVELTKVEEIFDGLGCPGN